MPSGVYKHKKHSKKTKEKMKIAKKNNPSPSEFKKGYHPKTEFKKGYHPVTEFKKGHIVSIETKEKISIAKQGYHPVNEFRKGQLGNKHPAWKNGKIKIPQGYILVYILNHSFARGNHILEHRFVVEQQINRYLLPTEVCHHINEIKNDNRPENLMAFVNKSAHQRFHHNPDNVRSNEIIFDGRKLIKGEKK